MTTMLNLSEAASLALHTMSHLAKNGEHRVTTREIAGKFHISKAHLAKVLGRLVHAGFISSARGPKGGFMLAKAPDAVTLLDVYEVIEGPISHNTCVFDVECGDVNCIFGGLIETVNHLAKKQLEETALSDLVAADARSGKDATA